MKLSILFISMLAACSMLSCAEKPHNEVSGNPDGSSELAGDVVKITSDLCADLSTDKALYRPGEVIRFTAENVPPGCSVRYRHEGRTVHEHEIAGKEWTWTAPQEDFTGYMVEVFRKKAENIEVIHGTIGVDVSSSWARYPRYGFVADFGRDKLEAGVIEAEMSFLNRCHINGIQFYDWHNKHHWPLGGTRNAPLDIYQDIANREVSAEALRKYIDVQHSYGMKCMFYNLCFGSLEDGPADGVRPEWYLYKNTDRTNVDRHNLPTDWKSDILLMDPSNPQWQSYLKDRNDDVYANFGFDGFHIDQLGGRGNLFDWNGNAVNLCTGYASFINAMKAAHPSKVLVMNSVGGYGGKEIAETGKVDFLYNEVWESQGDFNDLYSIIKLNDHYSGHQKNTVFAAYMNYNCYNRNFNVPGVLLTDAVIFALGGAHLELGDHMLCREYFPNQDVKMDEALRRQIVSYYDFMTAYETLLRGVDSKGEVKLTIPSSSVKLSHWPPKTGTVTVYAKQVNDNQANGKTVIHLLNFMSADNLSWRDLEGTMPNPRLQKNIKLKIRMDRTVNRVWMATPDFHSGACQEIAFSQNDGFVTLTLPALKYWDMLVLE